MSTTDDQSADTPAGRPSTGGPGGGHDPRPTGAARGVRTTPTPNRPAPGGAGT